MISNMVRLNGNLVEIIKTEIIDSYMNDNNIVPNAQLQIERNNEKINSYLRIIERLKNMSDDEFSRTERQSDRDRRAAFFKECIRDIERIKQAIEIINQVSKSLDSCLKNTVTVMLDDLHQTLDYFEQNKAEAERVNQDDYNGSRFCRKDTIRRYEDHINDIRRRNDKLKEDIKKEDTLRKEIERIFRGIEDNADKSV